MWNKYMISVEKFKTNHSKDFFAISSSIQLRVSDEIVCRLKNRQNTSHFDKLFSIYYSKHIDMDNHERMLHIEPKQRLNTVDELIILINFYVEFLKDCGDFLEVQYGLLWKDKTFLEGGCIIVDKHYPIILNLYGSSVVKDVLPLLDW